MLQALRSKAGSWVAKILFLLLILSFAAWGIGDIFRGQGVDTTVAEVGDVEIDVQTLDRAFRQRIEQLQPVFGGQLDVERAVALGLLEQTLEDLVQATLFEIAAAEADLRVPDEIAAARIREQPIFRNDLGSFDIDRFRRILARSNLTEAGYVASVAQDIARTTVQGAVAAGATAPDPLVRELYAHQAERRVAEAIFLPEDAVEVPAPTAEDVQAYHEEHAVQFTAPEYRDLTVAVLTLEAVAEEIAIPEEEVAEAYEIRSAEFTTPERRDLRAVAFEDEAAARAAVEAVRAGGDLAALAREADADVIAFEDATAADLPLEELATAAFATDAGGVADPVETALGWYVVEVLSVSPEARRPLEEVREQIVSEMRAERAGDYAFEIANAIEDDLAGGASVEEVAQRHGLEVMTVEQVDATGGLAAGGRPEGGPVVEEAIRFGFGLDAGETSRLTETPQGAYYLVRVDEVTPAAVRPLEEVREEVAAAWTAERRREAVAARAEELAEELRGGADVQTVAAEAGAEFVATEPFARDAADVGRLPQALVPRLFEMKPGEVAAAPAEGGHVVARLKEVVPADPETAGDEIAAVEQAVEQAIAADLLTQFAAALRREHGVEIDLEAVRSMYRN